MKAENYIIYELDGEQEIYANKDCWNVINKAAYLYAFDDCYPIEVLKIIVEGYEVHYAGWEPGMVFRFYGEERIEYEVQHEEWDH